MSHPTERCELTNLCMITDAENRILVQDRTDPSWPGICFPGGHVEPGESFVASVIREIQEETGLTIQDPFSVASSSSHGRMVPAMWCCYSVPPASLVRLLPPRKVKCFG